MRESTQMISIVTVARNHEAGLIRTLASVEKLEEISTELILVIGPSEDKTLEVAEKFCTKHPHNCQLIVQKSSGIYSAMNKGLQNARGESIIFMNAGDEFVGKASIENLQQSLFASELGLAIGGYCLTNLEGRNYTYAKTKLSSLGFAFSRHGGCHQSILYRTAALRYFEGYSEDLRIVSDFEVTLKIIRKYGGIRDSSVVSIIEPGGGADKEIFFVHRAKHKVRKQIFNSRLINILSLCWTVLAGAKVAFSKTLKFSRTGSRTLT